MGILTRKDISKLISEMEIFSSECPECPVSEITTIIRALFSEYEDLISDNKKVSQKYLSAPKKRPRKKLKQFPHNTPAHVRIVANVVKDKRTGCWVWPGAGTYNYGTTTDDDGTTTTVHRVMFEHANGRKLKAGEVVRHTCDNGFCCNPKHLLSGTVQENAADRVERNRSGVQKLTYKTAKAILIRFLKGEPARKLAEEFNIFEGNISRLGTVSFKKLADDADVKKLARKRGQLRHSKLTVSDVREIRRRLKRGDQQKDIAKSYGVNSTVISLINCGRAWRGVT